jgi:hypothetical protein
MNLELPDATTELATVIRRALSADAPAGRGLFDVLEPMGVLDLASRESPDPANAQLNVVVALEEVASAGRRGPVAETIWARSRGVDTDAEARAGFVAVASGARMGNDRLVPYGSFATSLLIGTRDQLRTMSMPAQARTAQIEIDADHLWLPTEMPAPALAALDDAFAWRAASATTVGAMARASEMAILHARQRVQFGKPLASFQALQFRLAECHWRLLGLRHLVREAAWRADRDDRRAGVVSALAWLYARDVGRIVTKHAHQVFGAIGFTRELGLTTVTGATATLRALYPARDAAEVVRAGREWTGDVPPSTVLGGFGRAATPGEAVGP